MLTDLRGVGPEFARKLAALDIVSPAHLARTYPRTYKDWRVPTPVAAIVRAALDRAYRADDSESAEEIALGVITKVTEFRRRIAIVSAELEDDSGRLRASWFGRRGFSGKLAVGDRVFVHGRVQLRRQGRQSGVEMNVLHHRILRDGERYEGAIVPIYPAGKDVSSRALATLIERNADALETFIHDVIPPAVLDARGYSSLRAAWRTVHHPATLEAAAAARERLAFEEFFAIALAAAVRRAQRHAAGGAIVLLAPPDLIDAFEAALPFALTRAQRKVIEAIYADLGRPAAMNRLLQGDVGSGKTAVAAAAIVLAKRCGVQSALMAPTEILAAQHAAKLAPLLLPFGIRLEALFGSLSHRSRAGAVQRIASGECDLAVGTHALITDDVQFARLGLAVIDEQHRFGVAQRAKLRGKSVAPHTLYMTATPIPRSLAQTRYADLDLSIIDELPPGRTPIQTYVLRAGRKPLAYEFVRKHIAAGQQAYVVAPAIDESDVELTSAIAELEVLQSDVFADLRVALLHGRLATRQKDEIMARFVRGDIDVLLATTVVEVGVDVANASVMVILDAHRYGLAQLHQLRGRVGRGAACSYCVLIAPDERADIARLSILAETNDGFQIAEEDLRLRGEGEFAGTAQAGGAGLLGSGTGDFGLYMRAKADADALVAADPRLSKAENRPLRSLLDFDATLRATLVTS